MTYYGATHETIDLLFMYHTKHDLSGEEWEWGGEYEWEQEIPFFIYCIRRLVGLSTLVLYDIAGGEGD